MLGTSWPPKSCSWGARPLLGLGGTCGEAGGGRGSPVPSRGVTCVLPIPWGHGHGPAGASLRNLLVLGARGCVHAVLGAGWGPLWQHPTPAKSLPTGTGMGMLTQVLQGQESFWGRGRRAEGIAWGFSLLEV